MKIYLEHEGTLCGVPGRYSTAHAWPDQPGRENLWSTQEFVSEWRKAKDGNWIQFEDRFDDNCKNGHNDFAITATIATKKSHADRDFVAGGCCHEEIVAAFPEVAHLIKWHLTGTEGPMHYLANTVYHASDRDYRGLLKGEKQQLKNGRTGQPVWQLVACNTDTGEEVKRIGGGGSWVDADECPKNPNIAVCYEPVWIEGEGKERNLSFARSSAVWPEATDEQLCLPKEQLQALLEARLPALLEAFKHDITEAGFRWEP